MIVVSGSSAGGLFYDVACQAAEPAKKEGRIWIKSSVPMTHFEFSPIWDGAEIGNVSIQGSIGGLNPLPTNNVIEVFLTKRNGIYHRMKTTPQSCYQVQGAVSNWAPVDAYVCHGDTWVQFSYAIIYLYNNGIFASGQSLAVLNNGKGGSFTAENNVLRYRCSGLGAFVVSKLSKNIDVTNLTTIKITFFNTYDYNGTNTQSWNMNLTLGVGGNTDDGVNTITAKASMNKLTKNTSYTLTVDVSKLTGMQPVYILLQSTSSQYLWIDVSVMEAY